MGDVIGDLRRMAATLGTLGRDGAARLEAAYQALVRSKDRQPLTEEAGGPALGSVRSPLSEYPASGLTPTRLAEILRAADAGDARAYLELAEQMEELDLHYAGVLATRKRTCAQEPMQVIAVSDDPRHVRHADLVRRWARRPEVALDLFQMLDGIGKGLSVVEVVWRQEADGCWLPERLAWRDPRWFRLDLADLSTPMLLGDDGFPQPLPPAKFIVHIHPNKSGIPLRSGVARLAAWTFMFKSFTSKDWQLFVAVYAQPLRVGKYHNSATEKDRDVLWEAVRNIGADCAAIIPETMAIQFIDAKNVGAGAGVYQARVDWLNRELSKAVLGQTATTEGQQGSHAVGKVHRQVQADISHHDALALAATLSRTLCRWIVDVNFGPQAQHPWLRLGKDEPGDLAQLSQAIALLVPLGLTVAVDDVRDWFGLSTPDQNAAVLRAPQSPVASPPMVLPPPAPAAGQEGDGGAAQLSALLSGLPAPTGPERLTATVSRLSRPTERVWLMAAAALLDRCTDLHEFADRLPELLAHLDGRDLAGLVGDAMTAAHLGGVSDVQDTVAADRTDG